MDFIVGGTERGITDILVYIKCDGLTYEIIQEAFERTAKARKYILDEIMAPVMPAPRKEVSKYAPRIVTTKINTDKIISILQSRGIKVRQAYFRQEQAFFSTLPLMINHKDVKEATKKNILTEGLVATYPFISSSICDTNGIFIGKNIYNNSLIFVDRYDQEKYKNANMCVFGTSGAGKSYYIKLNILRYRLFGIEQYVIDPEREYTGLCNKLEGTLLKLGPNSETYINVFDIR